MTDDLISRKALLKELRKLADASDCNIAILPDVAGIIRDAPAVVADDDRPHGHWISVCDDNSEAECSECGEIYGTGGEGSAIFTAFTLFYRYCPMCGARMDGGIK